MTRAAGLLLIVAALLIGSAPVARAQALVRSDGPESARPLEVGPGKPFKRIADAARRARDGAVVLIEPGDYFGDVASWPQNHLTLRAVRCCARLFARGVSAEGKAIWVIKGDDVLVENIEFHDAQVSGRNGAGIRQEGGGRLTVRNSRFTGNEMGLLTSNDVRAEIIVERSEFDHNGVAGEHRRGGPIGHQLYVGRIGRFTLRASYVHHGRVGHLVKSRARESFVLDNRLTDEEGGRASYELEFPDGGIAYVVGNIIEQSATTENSAMISFGAERFYWPRNELYLVNNTLANDLPGRRPVLRMRTGADARKIVNNLLVSGGWALPEPGFTRVNTRTQPEDIPGAARYDYRLARGSPLVGSAEDPGSANGVALRPQREYVHPRASRALRDGPYSPGALQSLAP